MIDSISDQIPKARILTHIARHLMHITEPCGARNFQMERSWNFNQGGLLMPSNGRIFGSRVTRLLLK